jgi:hypothetical protein
LNPFGKSVHKRSLRISKVVLRSVKILLKIVLPLNPPEGGLIRRMDLEGVKKRG